MRLVGMTRGRKRLVGMTMKAGWDDNGGGEWDDKEKGERGTLTFLLVNHCAAIGLEGYFNLAGFIDFKRSLLGLGFFVVDEEL